MKDKQIGLLSDNRYLNHKIDSPSLENPKRLLSINDIVVQKYKDCCQIYPARTADMTYIESVHSAFYLTQIKNHISDPNPISYDKDTYLMKSSLDTARLAAGGCLELIDQIMSGELDEGFAMIRPPGHHAEPGRGMGFCIFNNISVVANYLRTVYQLNRILILDFDAHHGNGTQEVFYETDEVMFISIHQQDLFPFSGSATEIGNGAGEGYNINIPVHSQFGDTEYTYLLGRLFQSVVEQYLPQIILVSAGYDGHAEDPISGTDLTTKWFGTVTTLLKQYANEFCDNKLLMILEGGYNVDSLQASILQTIDTLIAKRKSKIGVLHSDRGHKILKEHPLRTYWTL